uniref:SCP domain-containing protein n=1 Tax=Elaeophora elaphi TaxID=1147741 RepID=A0A0R3RIJ1_9BILA
MQRSVQGFLQRAVICDLTENASIDVTISNGDYKLFLPNSNNNNKKLLKKKEKRSILEEVRNYRKLITKREIAFSIDAKYRNKINEHCDDDNSYYFPALNECYRIYQTPYDNLNANYVGDRNELAYGTSQYDFMYNCWELYCGKLLDIKDIAVGEKMDLVKKIALQFYNSTRQRNAIRVGFMIDRNYEIMSQNGTFYDILDEVYVKMHPTEPCDNICCIVMRLSETNEVEMVQASCDHSLSIPNFFCQKQGNA